MFQGSKIFVAGGRTGFLGSNIAQALLQRGAEVHVHSASSKKPCWLAKNSRLYQHIGDLSVSAELPSGIDYVFHAAAHTSGAHEMVHNPLAQITPNVRMNENLLYAAAKQGVKKFLIISSSAVYPESDAPVREEQGFEGDPSSSYFGPAWMKRYSEKLAEFFHRHYGMEVVIIRPSNVYGPQSSFDLERAHVLPALMRKFVEHHNPLEIWGSPEVVRDFIYVSDFVRGLLLAFEQASGFEVFNIASGHLQTIGQSAEIISELTAYQGKVRYDVEKPMTIKKRLIDVSKAKERLGFQAEINFRDGLQETISWYKKNIV